MSISMVQYVAVAIIPILFAITVHEVAHGYVAKRFGDSTAQMLGRLTLNPIKHIDLVGTILVPAILLFAGGFLFGWAKPVPVDTRNFKNPKRDMIWVAVAGPMANLVMALIWAGVLKLSIVFSSYDHWLADPVRYMAQIGIQINIILMVLNLIPIPPLDGSKVLMGLLPGPVAFKLSRIEPYGFFIILALIFFGVLSAIVQPILHMFVVFISSVFHF